MTKAGSSLHDNNGLCELCNLPETLHQPQQTYPVLLSGGIGWGTMYLCPSCLARRARRGTVDVAPGTPSAFSPEGTFGADGIPESRKSTPRMVSLAAVKAWLLDCWEGHDKTPGASADDEYRMLVSIVGDVERCYNVDGTRKAL